MNFTRHRTAAQRPVGRLGGPGGTWGLGGELRFTPDASQIPDLRDAFRAGMRAWLAERQITPEECEQIGPAVRLGFEQALNDQAGVPR